MDKKIVPGPYSDYIGNNIYGEFKPEYKAYYERLNSRYPMNRFNLEWQFMRGDYGFSYMDVPKVTPIEWVLDHYIEKLFRYSSEYRNNKDHTFKLRFKDISFGIKTDKNFIYDTFGGDPEPYPFFIRIPIHQIPGILLFEVDQEFLADWNSNPEPIINRYYELEYNRLQELNKESGYEGPNLNVHDGWLCRQPETYLK